MAALTTYPQETVFETTTFQVLLERTLNIARQYTAPRRQMGGESRVVLFDNLIQMSDTLTGHGLSAMTENRNCFTNRKSTLDWFYLAQYPNQNTMTGMNIAINDTLYKRVEKKGFRPAHVAEVGVHEPESSNIYRYILNGVRITLVEPEPGAIRHIKSHFQGRDNVALHECAICDFDGEIELVKDGPSTFVADLPASPALVNDGFVPKAQHKFKVPAKRMEAVDDGSIELLSIDAEGSEWFVIKNLVSRPRVLSVETHGAVYVNPYFNEIMAWVRKEGYTTWYKTKTDTVFVCKVDWVPSLVEIFQLKTMEVRIRLRRFRKSLFRNFSS